MGTRGPTENADMRGGSARTRDAPDLNLRGAAIHLYAAYHPTRSSAYHGPPWDLVCGRQREPAGAHTQCFITWCAVRGSTLPPGYGVRHTHDTHAGTVLSRVCHVVTPHCVFYDYRLGPSPSRGHCVRLQSPSRPLIRPRPWDGLYLPRPPLAQSYPPTSRPPAQAQARAAQRRQPQRAPPSRCPH